MIMEISFGEGGVLAQIIMANYCLQQKQLGSRLRENQHLQKSLQSCSNGVTSVLFEDEVGSERWQNYKVLKKMNGA